MRNIDRSLPRDHAAITPDTRLATLARHPILDALSGPELVVYLRLVAATASQGDRVKALNLELHHTARTAIRALQALAEMGLVKLTYDDGGRSGRVIEVR